MDLIFVSDSSDLSRPLQHVATAEGHRVLRQVSSRAGFADFILTIQPDVIVFVCEKVDDSILQEIAGIHQKRPTPALMFTRDSSKQVIDAAVRAGVTTYVVDCADPDRLDSLLHVAHARFENQQRILWELNTTRKALQERKSIEKAKGIIMKQKRLSEDQAYRSMRKLAMDRNKRMGEIAEQIIAASEVLV